MNGQELGMLTGQNGDPFISISFIPIVGIIMTGLLFYFAYKFYRDESKMSFVDKVKFLKRLVNIALVLFASVLVFVMFIFVIVIFMSLSMGAFSPAIIVLFVMTVMAGAVLYLYYLMYKEYKVLINNFEQEQIFVDENVVAFKNIAKISMWILFISLAMSLIGYLAITVLAFIFTNIEPLMRLPIQTNFNGALNMSVFMDFIICVILNISAAVFEKAVKLCKENESNTVL